MTVSNVKSYSYDPIVAGKNFVINGGLDFWQRSTSPETPLYITSGNGYNADRWSTHQFQDALHSRSAITAGSGPISRYALRVGSPSTAQSDGGSRMVAASMIESVNSIFLRNQVVTYSFWIRFSSATFSSVTNLTDSSYGNFSYVLGYFTSVTDPGIGNTGYDSDSALTLINGSFPTVWTKYTITTTVPSNVNNIMPRFGFGSRGSTTVAGTNWYEIADVQLEENPTATQFSRAGGNYIEELRLCQRYFERISSDVIDGNFGTGVAYATTGPIVPIRFAVQKRVPPTNITFAGTWEVVGGGYVIGVTSPSVASNATTVNGFQFGATASGLTLGDALILRSGTGGSSIDISAEI